MVLYLYDLQLKNVYFALSVAIFPLFAFITYGVVVLSCNAKKFFQISAFVMSLSVAFKVLFVLRMPFELSENVVWGLCKIRCFVTGGKNIFRRAQCLL